ncbi:hypothetical protein CYMTET_48994 [Cymbomonas tetramitiformis]|uniref:DEK-C domain-containing protein n=1 Tax=Cymbomonas tetramitiformis TaxID=36881 RepID=A0AAE0BST6_9CHLO|nr:hypothetical protein CYMTET_48994 [Cymbomonas tetramitiformis]
MGEGAFATENFDKEMADEVTSEALRATVRSEMNGKPLEELTTKLVRRAVETTLGLSKGGLDEKKDEIKQYIDEFINEAEDEAEDEDPDDQLNDEPPAKKPKATTSAGAAPKNVKKIQASAMSGKQFESKAETLNVDVFGNIISGPPRTFTSGNRGWYAGGKIEIQVGGKKLWAQVGMNVSIIGSKEWAD